MAMSEKQRKHLEKLNSNQKNENNRCWKGDEVSYKGLHLWVRANKPMSECCQFCGKKRKLVAANISGEYKRDVDDFMWLCYSCHLRYDDVADKAWATKRRKTPSD